MDTKFSFFQSSFETSAGLPNVYCREKEMKTIKDFFTNKITKPSKANSSLYICGTPGMGKTLSVGEKNQKTKRSQPQKQKKKGKKKSLSDENEDSSDSNKSKESEESEENTESEESKDTDETDESDQTDESEGSDESSESEESEESEESDQFNSSDYEDNIYLEEKEFETQLYEMKEKSQIEKIEFFLKKLKEKVLIVVILDEIDYLVTKNKLNTLYQLFELANSEITNQFVVIGIANALDLTDRVLPYLTLRGIQPSVLGFKPYTIKQTTKILNQRLTLQSENSQGLSISEEAIEFCARKNAKFTGDIREALDICQDAIKVGYEKGEKIISLQTMIHVLNKYYSSTKSKIIENLPLQQKFLITCIMKLIKLKKNNDKSKTRKGTRRSLKTNNFNNRSNYTQKQLNDKKFFSLFILKQEYLNFCQQNKITSNNRLNFNSICENLIGSGIIKITNQKQVPRNRNQYLSRQFQVNVPLYDIKFALKEMPFYKTYIK